MKKPAKHVLNPIAALFKQVDPPMMGVFDPDALMEEMIELIKNYVVLSDHSAVAVSLWCVLTWCYQHFARCPILLINAPEKECGKTQLLKIIGKMACRPLETANVTMAALFRMVNEYGPTVLIDEADTFMNGKSEMAGIINNGYESGGYVMRMETDAKGEMHCCAYGVYGPKALAGIALERHLPDATMSRGIQVPMKRKTKADTVQRLRLADPQRFASVRSGILRFVLDNQDALANTTLKLPEQLGDRQQDCWEPLLIIAHCLGPEWYAKAVEAALAICAETEPPKSSSNQLLEDVREVLQGYQGQYIPSAQLLEMLHAHPDMDWCRYNHGQPLTARQLAKFLAPYDIRSKTVRMGNSGTPKGYEVRQFQEAFDRYLPGLPADSEVDPTPTASQFAPVTQAKDDPGTMFMYGDGGRPLPPAKK
ncbi:MAG: DUF3631 domain-containing protein, partial [Burkholderiaceae bacterium]